MKKRIVWIALAAIVLCTAAGLLWPKAQKIVPSEMLLAASEGLDDVSIQAQLDVEKRELTVTQEMHLQNRTGQRLDAAVLRTWPNAFQSEDTSPCTVDEGLYDSYYPDGFSRGALVVHQAQVNGEAILHRYLDDAKTVLQLPVPGGWQAEAEIVIQLDYTVQIPCMAYRFGVWDDVWALGNAFVIPAVWEDGAYRTDAYAPVGDPFVSDCMNYDVTVSVPKGYLCAGSGYPTVETADGRSSYHFASPAVRDFALVISDRFHTAQAVQDGVRIIAYALESSQARDMLKYAKKAFACYSDLFGDAPYPAYTIAQVSFPHDGAEYPQLSMIGSGPLAKGGRELEYAVAHEAAHQWWYAAVGSDGYHQPWQDEALYEFSLLAYAERQHGAGERADLERSRMESALRVTVSQGVTPGAPLDAFTSWSEYELVTLHRGAACLCALDRTVDGGLTAFLRDYYTTYAFLRASRQDFEALLAKSTGEDLTPLLRDYLDTHIRN